jgi:hypothetical protein
LLSSIDTFCVADGAGAGAGTALGAVLADFEVLDVLEVADVFEVVEAFGLVEVFEVFDVLAVFDVVEVFEVVALVDVVAALELVFEVLDDGVDGVDLVVGAGCWVSVAACAPVMPRHKARALEVTTVFRLSKRIPTSLKSQILQRVGILPEGDRKWLGMRRGDRPL